MHDYSILVPLAFLIWVVPCGIAGLRNAYHMAALRRRLQW